MSQASNNQDPKGQDFLTSPEEYFSELVESACGERRLEAKPLTRKYLTELLQFYLFSDNLFDSEQGRTQTMAERLLKAVNLSEPKARAERLRRVGDTALYVSGFFGDSFKRKIIDIDYYVEIGGSAYATVASSDTTSMYSPVFKDLSQRFGDFVDLLTHMSQEASLQSDHDLLRLYDRYIMTGSKLAEEKLEAEGLLNSDVRSGKTNKQ